MSSVHAGTRLMATMPRGGNPFRALQDALRGRYELMGEVGRGAMGIVYLAYERALQRPVALKLLPPAAAQSAWRDRFVREARTVAKLSHPNIVPIFAVDQVGDFVFFTMLYVEGQTLAERIELNGPLPAGEVAGVLRQVAEAVGYAHRHGVIHRDLKPQNILLERGTGRALVMDFGLARMEAELRGADAGAYVEGTIPYVSPERAQGQPGDGRSDIYALGVTAFLAATGRLPFDGDTADDVLSQHVHRPAPPLEVRGRDGDDTVARAVARCLAKDPDERFQTGNELAASLSQAPELRGDTPVPLRAFAGRLRQTSQSGAGLSLLGGLAAMTLLTGLWAGDWGVVAGAAGFIALLVAAPLAALLPVTRRVLEAGYGRENMVRVLTTDLALRREELAFEHGANAARRGRVARLVSYAALGLTGLGTAWLAFLEAGADVALWVTVLAAVTAIVAGLAGAVRGRRRHSTFADELWLRFWKSPLGEWATSVAGLGVGPLDRSAGSLAEGPGGQGKPSYEVPDVVRLMDTQIAQLRALLEGPNEVDTAEDDDVEQRLMGSLATLEGLRGRLQDLDGGLGAAGGVSGDLAAARKVCEMVEVLLGARVELGEGGRGMGDCVQSDSVARYRAVGAAGHRARLRSVFRISFLD